MLMDSHWTHENIFVIYKLQIEMFKVGSLVKPLTEYESLFSLSGWSTLTPSSQGANIWNRT